MAELTERLVLEFTCRGTDGRVRVRYSVNNDRDRWGFPLLGAQAAADTNGFPVCEAVVEYAVEGYGAYLGWVQLLDVVDTLNATRECTIDLPPMLMTASTPFITFGPEPRLFDAPAMTSDEKVRREWTATTYLCAAGGVFMTPEVYPVVAFAWGFTYEPGRPVAVRDPTPAAGADWRRHRQVLAAELPGWAFLEQPPRPHDRAR